MKEYLKFTNEHMRQQITKGYFIVTKPKLEYI